MLKCLICSQISLNHNLEIIDNEKMIKKRVAFVMFLKLACMCFAGLWFQLTPTQSVFECRYEIWDASQKLIQVSVVRTTV